MNNINRSINKHKYKGFSLIELMVAMVIGIIVLLGLVSLFTNSSILNKAQTGLATLQENGRYAISRLRSDVELAGRKHCATLAMPNDIFTNWDQGYALSSWRVDSNVSFAATTSTNGLPLMSQIELDLTSDADQLPDPIVMSTLNEYPLDPRYLIKGHECGASTCIPAVNSIGSDAGSNLRAIGIANGDRAANTDILTVRYLTGGNRVQTQTGNTFTLNDTVPTSNNLAMVADCQNSYIANATWNNSTLTLNAPNFNNEFSLKSDTRAFNMTRDFRTVSYFVGIDTDPNDSSRSISSLYRSENGDVQQLIEGVERFDVFYLAQTQTGHVARLTADEVQTVSGGGDGNQDDAMDSLIGCILPPEAESPSGYQLANGAGCLWRSIYAIELHLLINTVNDSSMLEDDVFIYSPDGVAVQTPSNTLPSGLNRERMYRREFTATIPIRSYTL